MASLNHCQFIGNLGKDPELTYLPSGDAVANFSIACTEKWKDKSTGETKEQTEWVRLVCFAKKAELAGEYLKKGSPVYVQCRMRTRKWQDKEGVDRYSTEFVVDQMQFLGGKSSGDGSERAQQQAQAYQREASGSVAARPAGGGAGNDGFADLDDDIPFIDCAHDVLGAKFQRRMRKTA